MVAEGSLTSFGRSVAQIAREESSCALWLTALGVSHEIIFREGMPVYATPQSGVNDLVSVMLNARQISEARATELLAALPASPTVWEQNLSFFDGVVSRGELYGVLESAVRTRLLALFAFDVESIERREIPATTGVPMFRIEPARLVIDGVLAHFSDDTLARECPLDANATIRARFDAISRFSDLTLTPTEMDRVSRVDGKRLAAFGDLGFQEVGAVHRFICALSILGIVEIEEAEEVGRAADEEDIEEIGVVYGGDEAFAAAPEAAEQADFSLTPEAVAPKRPTLTARIASPTPVRTPAATLVSAPTVAESARPAAPRPLPAQPPKPASPPSGAASAFGASPAPKATLPGPAATKEKPAKKISPLFQKFPQFADKDFFSLLGVGRQFQPFEVKNGLTAALKPLNLGRFDQAYKGVDADLALQLIEHLATAFVAIQDPKYKAQYVAHLDAKGDELFRLSDAPGKAAVDAAVGDILLKNKVYAQAEKFLVRAGDGNGKSAEYQFLIAKNLYLWAIDEAREMPTKIKGALDNAIALNTQYYDAYLYLGYYYKQVGKNDLALRKFKEAVEVNQKGHEAASEIRLLSIRTSHEKKKTTFFGITLGKKSGKDK
jgi:hypothetical protein